MASRRESVVFSQLDADELRREFTEDDEDDFTLDLNEPSYRARSASHSYADEKSFQDMHAKYHALQMDSNDLAAKEAGSSVASHRDLEDGESIYSSSFHEPIGSPMSIAKSAGKDPDQTSGSKSVVNNLPFHIQSIYGTYHQGNDDDPLLFSELKAMYEKVEQCIELRHKFMAASLQREEDNPKNSPGWNIYPAPPKPSWNEQSKEFKDAKKSSNGYRSVPAIGTGFNYNECDIPDAEDKAVFAPDKDGVYQVYEDQETLKHGGPPIVDIPSLREYYKSLDHIIDISSDGPSKSFAFRRLEYLEAKWKLYSLLNEYKETAESKKTSHRDFYNVRKVDTHVHHSACMNQKHLLRFIKYKMKRVPNEIVLFRDDKVLTLQEVFDSLGLKAYDLSIDKLDMHAHKDTFHRFDKFNLKYNPIGESRLREIFLKTDNYIHGRYLADLTREVFEDLEQSKYQHAEYRISVYGRSIDEWDKLAAWVVDNKLFSHNVRWLIQVPRLYDVYKKGGLIKSFAQVIENLFKPLFEVTQNPASHPKLHIFLCRVVGFDSVDDESKLDRRIHRKFPVSHLWDSNDNPPYSYYLYYLYANIASLNNWRKRKGYNTLVLRPHSGEAGDPEHLMAAYLTSYGISHGILLRKVPFIQYLYFLDQIGIAMSPLSNNALFLSYAKNPFYNYFIRGLNVSLSSDDPLQFSYTREPLIEEYSVAAQIFKLSNVDMSELARNSVKQSGFERVLKSHWLGANYTTPGPSGNRVDKTNVPNVRISYREETYLHEVALIEHYTGRKSPLNYLNSV